jgi:2-oxoglutarate dehydrogenase complex dehydrogenase (E1) component-like enzyme
MRSPASAHLPEMIRMCMSTESGVGPGLYLVLILAPCRSPHPPAEEHVKRLLLCSGKVYYDLNKKRAEKGLQKDIAIVRLEQVGSAFQGLCISMCRR